MRRLGAISVLIVAAVIWGASAAFAVDFPPEILFDQYLLEAKRALEDTTRRNRKINRRKAAEAFKRIEGLNLELSLEFRFFYGKFLASADPSESVQLAKGMSLLKQYVLEAGRNAEHYADALELLSTDKMKGALMTACFHGHTEAVRILLGEGVNDLGLRRVSIGDVRFPYSPIDVAARYGHAEIVKLLLAAGSGRYSSFAVAIEYGHVEIARVLIDKLPDTYNFTSLLKYNARHPDVVKVLIAAGADPNVKFGKGRTLLHSHKFGTDNAEVVKVLIAGGADPNVMDEYGDTPLHDIYYRRSDAEFIMALIAGGADPNAKDKDGKTPLYRAMRPYDGCCSSDCDDDLIQGPVRALLSGGADLNPKDPAGVTLLHDIVGQSDRYKCTKFLLDMGADPNVRDNDGNTPLHHFAMHERAGLRDGEAYLRILVAAGADLNVKNNDGKRPRRLAGNGNWTATILKRAGAKK